MVYRRVKTSKKRKLQRRTRKYRGGSENTKNNTNNTNSEIQEFSNIFDVIGKTKRAKQLIFERLREVLKGRDETWLVFFAKFGNDYEKLRFADPRWIFSDNEDNMHEKNNDDRILIKMNYQNKEDIKLLFDICSGCFDYITFDGAITGVNIDEDRIDSFIKGLKPEGILASQESKSEILKDGINYRVGIFNNAIGTVPQASGTSIGNPVHRLKSLIWLMIKANEMNIPFNPQVEQLANAIGFYSFTKECQNIHANMYYFGQIPSQCKINEDKIKEQAKSVDIFTLRTSLLEDMINVFELPKFDETKKINSKNNTIPIENRIVLIQKTKEL